MKIRVTVTVEGRVQGVNFRYHTRQTAQRLNVLGWIENAPDGSVHGCFEGEETDVNALVDWCRTGPPAAKVAGVRTERENYTGEFFDFHVRHQ